MPIHYVSGDLFTNRHHALAHGCNCEGSMGAGIAKEFKACYPAMFEEYRRRCEAEPRQFNLGDCFWWQGEGKPAVFNLGTQERYWHARASYEAIEQALGKMKRRAGREHITSIAIPRIGTGYGGLSWRKVVVIIERVFANWPHDLYVYEEFVPEGKSAEIINVKKS